jgi:hypothetical protein
LSHRSAVYGRHTPPWRSQGPSWLREQWREKRSSTRRRRFLIGYAVFAILSLGLFIAAVVA